MAPRNYDCVNLYIAILHPAGNASVVQFAQPLETSPSFRRCRVADFKAVLRYAGQVLTDKFVNRGC